MGKWIDRKKAVEDAMGRDVDAIVAQFERERDEALNLVQPVRAQRMPEIVERYRSRISARHEEAVEAEARLFADLLAEVEKVVTEPPSSDQLAYLQTLSLKSSLTPGDIQAAEKVMAGNAVALSALRDLAGKHGIADAPLNAGAPMPPLQDIADGLEEYRKATALNIRRYGVIDLHSGNVSGNYFTVLDMERVWDVFRDAEAAVERFGAE